MRWFPILKAYVRQVGTVLLASVIGHALIVYLAIPLVEMGDMQMFKIWSHQAQAQGIHKAFLHPDFRYDWLPLYLYVSKAIGWFYAWSGLQSFFGPWSSALTAVLKMAMVSLHICTAFLIYALCLNLGKSERQAKICSLIYTWHPGLIVATDIYGYQDAFHTLFVVAACVSLFLNLRSISACLFALIFLTKPQAVIYLLPFACWGVMQFGLYWLVRGGLIGVGMIAMILVPFWWHGTLHSVFDMYLGVTSVHEWLTGCAHNFWWLVSPVPPFESDRVPLLFGLSGIQIGLVFFSLFAGILCWRLMQMRTPWMLIETCALLGFGFFMLVTEIHENHHFAMFAFLVPLAFRGARGRLILFALTCTFAINLILTNYWLETGQVFEFGGVRLETVNAIVNASIFCFWCYQHFQKKSIYEQT